MVLLSVELISVERWGRPHVHAGPAAAPPRAPLRRRIALLALSSALPRRGDDAAADGLHLAAAEPDITHGSSTWNRLRSIIPQSGARSRSRAHTRNPFYVGESCYFCWP